ncbi:MAG: CoA-binding protein [Candidatus Omnitrophica bacterium]|nr:CoA-binding protein [Candidatus Omnitrophota bacterium]
MNIAIIGASDKKERYSYKAFILLQKKGHKVYPVNARLRQIDGVNVFRSIKDIREKIDAITLYVNESISESITEEILEAKPRKIIFNPGAENEKLLDKARASGIEAVNACTLVLAQTNRL